MKKKVEGFLGPGKGGTKQTVDKYRVVVHQREVDYDFRWKR
jgi:hypothetical protein